MSINDVGIRLRFTASGWRWRLSLTQGILAAVLLVIAARQEREHYDWLEFMHPERLPEMDRAYGPPAELIAVTLNGPSILPGFSGHVGEWFGVPPVPKFEIPIRLLGVFSFWFVAGSLIERRLRNQSLLSVPSLHLSAAISVIGAISCALAALAVGKGVLNDVINLISLDFLWTYIRIYGSQAAIWTNVALLVWFAALLLYFSAALFARSRSIRSITTPG